VSGPRSAFPTLGRAALGVLLAVLLSQAAPSQAQTVALYGVAGNGQSATEGSAFSPLVVGLSSSGPVADAPVVFTVTSGSASFPDNARTATVNTDADGLAAAPTLSAGPTAGEVTVSVTSSAAADASFQFMLTVTAPTAAVVAAIDGNGQSAPAGTPFGEPLVVEVMDSHGHPLPNAPVTFSIVRPEGGGTATFPSQARTAQLRTDGNGRATSPTLTAGSVGPVLVTATSGDAGADFDVHVTAPAPATIGVVSGDKQSALPGAAFADPLGVKVLDAQGRPATGDVTVTFAVVSGSATFPEGRESAEVGISHEGNATAPELTAGPATGPVVVEASVADSAATSARFEETVAAFVPSELRAVSGAGQSALTGAHFMDPLVVQVLDQNGSGLSDVVVTFDVSGPASIYGRTSVEVGTNHDGQAAAAGLMAGTSAGPVRVTATAEGLKTSVVFDETVTARVPTTIVAYSGGGQSAAAGTAFAQPLVALVLDQTHMIMPGQMVTFRIEGGATFNGASAAKATTDAGGSATSPHLIAGPTAGSVTITASVDGVSRSASFSEQVTRP
jgi:hypothetical protein